MKHHRRTKPVIKDLFEDRKISITGFAGCGGADLGVKAATGHEPAIAINHDSVEQIAVRIKSARGGA